MSIHITYESPKTELYIMADNQNESKPHNLFDITNKPTPELIRFLQLVGMEVIGFKSLTLADVNEWAQKNLLRKGERWEGQEAKFDKIKAQIYPYLREWGFLDASHAKQKEYKGAILHASLVSNVRNRLHFLIGEWKRGVRFSKLYFWTGGRPLEPKLENQEVLYSDKNSLLKFHPGWNPPAEAPKTEREMVQMVWEQAEVPQDMRELVHVVYINVPMKKDPITGKDIRPTTDDTAVMFFEMQPEKGSYLAISNGQYRLRQALVVDTLAPAGYAVETIGAAAKEGESAAVLIDEVARYIYQMKKFSEKM